MQNNKATFYYIQTPTLKVFSVEVVSSVSFAKIVEKQYGSMLSPMSDEPGPIFEKIITRIERNWEI